MIVLKPDALFVSLLIFSIALQSINAGRIYYEKCDYKGFSCTKSLKVPGRYDIVFKCNTLSTWDVEFYLWQFRAPTTITSFEIKNCTNVRLNLVCTGEGRPIQSLKISNVTKLTLTPIIYGVPHIPPEFILEDIQQIDQIPSRMFLQIKKQPFSKYGCFNPSKDLESITFKNIKIGSIEREAFHNLIDMKNFTFENVSVDRIHTAAIQAFMFKDTEFKIIGCNIKVIDLIGIFIRGNKLIFNSNNIQEMYTSALNATVFDLHILNNSFGWWHTRALSVLSQNVIINDNTFSHVSTGAFQGIGPGLPENSLRGFGNLKFIYSFQSNLVESLEVASLHPDYHAYKNVANSIKFTYNAIKCTCAEIKWLEIRDGFGKNYLALADFYSTILKLENNNICSDAPCILPLETVRLLSIQNGRCIVNLTQEKLCSIYYSTTETPTTTIKPTTSLPVIRKQTTKTNLNIYKINSNPLLNLKQRISYKSNGNIIKSSLLTITVLLLIACWY